MKLNWFSCSLDMFWEYERLSLHYCCHPSPTASSNQVAGHEWNLIFVVLCSLKCVTAWLCKFNFANIINVSRATATLLITCQFTTTLLSHGCIGPTGADWCQVHVHWLCGSSGQLYTLTQLHTTHKSSTCLILHGLASWNIMFKVAKIPDYISN